MVSQEVGLTQIPGDHETLCVHSPPCRIPCRRLVHKIFFLGLLGLHLIRVTVN